MKKLKPYEKICFNCKHAQEITSKDYIYCTLHNISIDKKDKCSYFKKEFKNTKQ